MRQAWMCSCLPCRSGPARGHAGVPAWPALADGSATAPAETRVLEYLRQNFADREVSAGKITAIHGISERYLDTVLARVGITLRPWLREQLLTAAADALTRPANRRLTIAATAHRWGFADQAHFTREFRKHFGMTPAQWRNHPSESQLPG